MSALYDDKCSSEAAELMPLLTTVKSIPSLRQLTSRVESLNPHSTEELPSSQSPPTLLKIQNPEAVTCSPVSAVNSLLVPSSGCKVSRQREECPGERNLAGDSQLNGTLLPFLPVGQPLITVTINPLEKDEMTFVPPSPLAEQRGRTLMDDEERKLSIGSASSFDEEDDANHLRLASRDIRRVSDISHINELRREISGMSHLASEYYEVKTTADPDNISLDSIHVRVLSRCAKYQVRESKSDRSSRYFVIITTSLTIIGISCGFWYKNFSGLADESH